MAITPASSPTSTSTGNNRPACSIADCAAASCPPRRASVAFSNQASPLSGSALQASSSAAAASSHEGGAQVLGPAAWGVFLATFVHKPADALTIVSLMIRGGTPKPLAHLVNLGFALMIPAGVGLFFLGIGRLDSAAADSITAASLAFSAGTFLCIALSDLLPELQFHSHDRLKLSAALLGGFLMMWGASLWEGPGSHETMKTNPSVNR